MRYPDPDRHRIRDHDHAIRWRFPATAPNVDASRNALSLLGLLPNVGGVRSGHPKMVAALAVLSGLCVGVIDRSSMTKPSGEG